MFTRTWIAAMIVSTCISIGLCVAGIYAMVSVYGWEIVGYMALLSLVAGGLPYLPFILESRSDEARRLDAAVERAHREE